MIVNIRGTSGSGKSTLVRQIIDNFALTPAKGTPTTDAANTGRKVYGYWSNFPIDHKTAHADGDMGLAVVGDYSNDCGGCDGIKTQDDICDRVRYLSRVNHVVFEGLLISHIYGRYRDLHHELGAADGYLWAFLDTPLDVCLERVKLRRYQRAVRKGMDPEQAKAFANELDPTNTIQKWHDARRVFNKADADGLRPVWISHEDAYADLMYHTGWVVPEWAKP